MTKSRRRFRRAALASGVLLLCLVLILILVAPRLIKVESIREQLQAEFATKVGGKLDFEEMDLSLLPRPTAIVRRANIMIPEKVRGSVASLKVCPAILPLFRGKIRIARISVQAPDFELPFPGVPEPKTGEPPSATLSILEQRTAALFGELATKAPNLEAEIKGGRIDLVDAGRPVITLQDVDAEVVLPPVGARIHFTCGSNLWKTLSLQGNLDARTLDGKGRIEVSQLQPHLLVERLLPAAGFACAESTLYLRMDVRTDGMRTFRGQLKASLPKMTLRRGKQESTLEVENIGISFSIAENKTELSLDQLKLDHPRLSLFGTLSVDWAVPDIRLDLEARQIDAEAVRKVALCLGGDIRLVRDIFDYVRGGEIPVITFRSQASAFDQLGKDEVFRIEGRLLDGRIHIKGPGLDPEEVKGDVLISHGILEGKNLEARLGNSRGSQGKLRVGLNEKDAPFHLDIKVDADMAEVHPILMRVVKAETFVRDLSMVENVEGRSLGRLILGESLQAIQAKVDVSECRISADYHRIPYSVRIEGGEIAYDTDSIGGRNMSGTLGNSFFSGFTYRLVFGEEPRLEIDSGQFRLLMDEIYPWLVSYESIRDDLKSFRDVKGKIEIEAMRLKGPLLTPADWDFEATGLVKDMDADTTLCPGNAKVASGRFRANPEELSFTGVKAKILDSSLDGSGVLQGYLRKLERADIELSGRVGPEGTRWQSDSAGLPPALRIQRPFTLTGGKLVWNRDGQTSFKGAAAFPRNLQMSLDAQWKPEEFILRQLSFRDEVSRATLSLTRTRGTYGLKFTGNLTQSTLDKVFAEDLAPGLTLKGDFLLDLRLDKPEFSKGQGYLEAKGLNIPYGWLAPIKTESLSLEASEKGLNINSAHLNLEESHIDLEGGLNFSADGILVDMDLASEGIEWATLQGVIDRARTTDQATLPPGVRVGGTVRCRAAFFKYGTFTWQPLHASVTFSPDMVRIAVTEADLCGISTLGVLNVSGEGTSLDFRLIAKDRDLEPTFPCLAQTERRVTGRFDLTGEIEGQGKGDTLLESCRGGMEFSASKGRILRDPLLAKIFSLLNVTELFRGKKVDLRSDDLAYDSLHFKAALEKGNLLVEAFTLEGPTVGIAGQGSLDLLDKRADLTFLLAPLRTVDFIVEKTPVVSSITGGKLITVPIRVKGDWSDPDVTMLSAASVGNRLLSVMKNTLLLPIEIVEPVIPREREQEVPSE